MNTHDKETRDAAESYADKLWNISSDPKDWTWEDSVRDFLAGAEWQRERILEMLRSAPDCACDWQEGERCDGCIASSAANWLEERFSGEEKKLLKKDSCL